MLSYFATALTPEWIGIGMTMLLTLVGIAKSFGYDKRRLEDDAIRAKQHEDNLKALELLTRSHLKDCDDRHLEAAIQTARLQQLMLQAGETSCTLTWLGDCMVGIGVKVDAKLPQRP